MGGNSKAHKSCSLAEILVFSGALVAGTLCSLTSKVMLTMKGTGMTGELEDFSYPLFQTYGMFLGMTAALLLHFWVKSFRIPFPGYNHAETSQPIPLWVYLMLAIPSTFDLVATILAMYGLRNVSVSIYQMLRGSAIIFVAILKQFVLKHPLQKFKWVGVALNVLSVVVVGLTALLSESNSSSSSSTSPSDGSLKPDPFLGVILILCGAFVQSLQYAFEEKVMTMNDDDDVPPTPPLLLIGMEGFWGTVICTFILYPLAYYYPGPDHGSFENPYNTIALITNSPEIQRVFTIYFFSILMYNVLAVLVTYMLDSVWHAILDNFRPITVWGSDLFIFYFVSKAYGEEWTIWSWLQLSGMFILLYGTAIYNAPNPGSLKLKGDMSSLYFDCTDEYQQIENEEKIKALTPRSSGGNHQAPFLTSMSPAVAMSPAIHERSTQRRALADQERRELIQDKNYGSINGV